MGIQSHFHGNITPKKIQQITPKLLKSARAAHQFVLVRFVDLIVPSLVFFPTQKRWKR